VQISPIQIPGAYWGFDLLSGSMQWITGTLGYVFSVPGRALDGILNMFLTAIGFPPLGR
jgi:hypothetical protein